MLGRAIVLVREDQLSLAIGRRGQNVRLASKLCGWDIEIMTREELDEQIEQAVAGFSSLEGVEPELAEKLVGEGFLSYDDLSVIEPDALMEMGGLTAEQVDQIVAQAEAKAEEAEKAAAEQRRQQREQDRRGEGRAEKAEAEEPQRRMRRPARRREDGSRRPSRRDEPRRAAGEEPEKSGDGDGQSPPEREVALRTRMPDEPVTEDCRRSAETAQAAEQRNRR